MIDLNKGDTRLIIDECKSRGVLRNQCAYVLATTSLETGYTMKPINERGGNAYFKKMYDIKGRRPAKARELGNLSPGDGAKYHGRGYVQITGKTNYKRASDKIGVDFIADPEAVLEPKHAAPILIVGMIEGWFTGRKLSDYITLQTSNFKQARRIINGTDKWNEIAAIAEDYDRALIEAGYGITSDGTKTIPPVYPKPKPKPEVEVAPKPPASAPPGKQQSTWTTLAALIGRLFRNWRKS